MLFEEQEFDKAASIWKQFAYEDLQASRGHKNIEYLKIVLHLRDEVITEQPASSTNSNVNLLAQEHFRKKRSEHMELEDELQST